MQQEPVTSQTINTPLTPPRKTKSILIIIISLILVATCSSVTTTLIINAQKSSTTPEETPDPNIITDDVRTNNLTRVVNAARLFIALNDNTYPENSAIFCMGTTGKNAKCQLDNLVTLSHNMSYSILNGVYREDSALRASELDQNITTNNIVFSDDIAIVKLSDDTYATARLSKPDSYQIKQKDEIYQYTIPDTDATNTD